MMTERERIKRQIGYGEGTGEYKLDREWNVTTYLHVDGERYPVTDVGDRFLVRVTRGVYVYGETLEDARERVIEALESAVP